MAPSLTIDNASDFSPVAKIPSSNQRTLLLAPPSIASHESALQDVFSTRDRSVTDLQMLDRLLANLVTLPDATYDLVLILTDGNGTNNQYTQFLTREVFSKIFGALKAGGKLEIQDGSFSGGEDLKEGILAGLVMEGRTMVKPDYSASDAVPLKLRRKDKTAAVSSAGPPLASVAIPLHGKRKSIDITPSKPAGVGFVDFSDDFDDPLITGEDDDDELIDEDTLLTEEDKNRPVQVPPECAPRVGKRRKACKDCTCGLAEKLAKEDTDKRDAADVQLQTLKLGADELAEIDFTVQGKVGSCGNCSLGDAFRCDGCPYIGMPAFKEGEEVRLLNNDVQL